MASKSRDNSASSQKAAPHWEQILRKFSQAHKEECKSVSLEIPRVQRSTKEFPTGSQYDGTWDVLGMSGHGTYTFPNGVIYEGAFDDGTFHGSGELRYPSGAIVRGKWRRGEIYERTLIFAEGLEYSEVDWQYCKMPDRRFSIEYDLGLKPAGESYLTAMQPTREIPPGCYDTEDGFYDPNTKAIYKAEDLTHIVRSPGEAEQQWIIQNCRVHTLPPLGPRKDLYETWSEPQIHHPPVVKPAVPSRIKGKSSTRVTHEPSLYALDSETVYRHSLGEGIFTPGFHQSGDERRREEMCFE